MTSRSTEQRHNLALIVWWLESRMVKAGHMIQRFALAVLVLAVASTVAGASPAFVVYRSPFEPPAKSGEFYDFKEMHTGARGKDTTWPFKTCPETSPFACLYIDEIDFALSVPKRPMPDGAKWRVGKYSFVIRHSGLMKLLGKNLNYTVIDMIVDGAPEGHAHIREVYDPRLGMVCYTYLDWKDRDTGKEVPYETEVQTACAEDVGLWPRER